MVPSYTVELFQIVMPTPTFTVPSGSDIYAVDAAASTPTYQMPLQVTKLLGEVVDTRLQYDLTFYEKIQPNQDFVHNNLYFSFDTEIDSGGFDTYF